MKKNLIKYGIIAVVILAVIGLIYASATLNNKEKEENSHLISLTFTELQEKINNKENFILLITKSDCSFCEDYKPVFKKVLNEYDVYAYELSLTDLTAEQKGQLNDIANVSGTPATIFIEEGMEKNTSSRITGAKSESKIISRLKAMGYIEE